MLLKRGINLGGYLSQCCHEEAHYEEFIREEDIRQISNWGFDHIRLPIDYNVFETDDGAVKEYGFLKVRQVIDWCKSYQLDIVLDLHKAYGYDFNDAGDVDKNNLFSSENLQKRFVDLWIAIVEYFGNEENVAFELLNEVVEQENAEAWNRLIHSTLTEIRKRNTKAPVIYGGIQWNSVKTLKLLDIPKDENVIFTFHFYEPLLFTHQKAHWMPAMDPTRTVHYPDSMDYYREKSSELGFQGEVLRSAQTKNMGVEFMEEMICEAIDAADNAGVSLYCGEFGVIDQAPVEDTLRWFRDVDEVFRKYNIGCAVWSYKRMDFGLIENHYESIKEALIDLWCNRK